MIRAAIFAVLALGFLVAAVAVGGSAPSDPAQSWTAFLFVCLAAFCCALAISGGTA